MGVPSFIHSRASRHSSHIHQQRTLLASSETKLLGTVKSELTRATTDNLRAVWGRTNTCQRRDRTHVKQWKHTTTRSMCFQRGRRVPGARLRSNDRRLGQQSFCCLFSREKRLAKRLLEKKPRAGATRDVFFMTERNRDGSVWVYRRGAPFRRRPGAERPAHVGIIVEAIFSGDERVLFKNFFGFFFLPKRFPVNLYVRDGRSGAENAKTCGAAVESRDCRDVKR